MAESKAGKGIYTMSLDHHAVPESKEVLKKQANKQTDKKSNWRGHEKGMELFILWEKTGKNKKML